MSRHTPSPKIVTTIKSKRTFPASSGSSLASVGEELDHRPNFDISTLLPVSPDKIRHLLRDEEMITREILQEAPSFLLPAKPSPAKTARNTPSSSRTVKKAFADVGDVTMGVKDLMAKMNKPKRASGTEESFADLLQGEKGLEGVDM